MTSDLECKLQTAVLNSLFGFDSTGTRPVVLCIVLNQTIGRIASLMVVSEHLSQCLYRPFDGGATVCERRESERRLTLDAHPSSQSWSSAIYENHILGMPLVCAALYLTVRRKSWGVRL
jgi:hypothetical protein